MGKILGSRRILAAILIVIVAVSVTGLSTYQVMNNQKFTQQSYILGLILFQMSQPRIVSCAPSIDEILLGLGLEGYIVGCASNTYSGSSMEDYYLPKIMELILAGKIKNTIDWWSPSLEEITKLNPTIVLLDSGTPSHISIFSSLWSQGVNSLLISKGTRISEIESEIIKLGSIFQRSSMAQALVERMEAKISYVQEKILNQTILKVLFCVWINVGGNHLDTCGNETFLSEIIQKAGGLNVFYDSSSLWPSYSLGEAAARNPDKIVILDHSAFLDPVVTLAEIANSPLNITTAWQNGEIYFIQGQADNLFTRSGPRVAEGVELLANILFPILFNVNFTTPHVVNTGNYKGYLTSFILE